MAGNNSITGDQTVTFTDNLSFDGTERNGLSLDGELWIGSATANRPDNKGHVRKNLPTINANGNLAFGPGTITINPYNTAKWIVDPIANIGTHTTITAALAAASSGETIFVRPGTYTENLTLKSGVCIASRGNSFNVSSPVIIVGKATLTSGTAFFDNISFRTNGDYIFDASGSSTINCFRCFFNFNDFAGFLGVSARFNLFQCNALDGGGNNQQAFVVSGALSSIMQGCYFSGSTSTASTFSGGSGLTISNSAFFNNITTADTSRIQATNTSFGTIGVNRTFTFGGTGTNVISNCNFGCGTGNISIGAGVTVTIGNSLIDSSNASVITGSGTLVYSGISFTGTGSVIDCTAQTPRVLSNDAIRVKAPGAYPYTTVPQDGLILVDTSAARTINLNASPVTGQTYRIKDNVGSAASNNITITPAAGNIDGAASFPISTNYGAVDVVYSGAQWVVL